MPEVKVKKLYPDAIIPKYASAGDAGADLYAYETYVIPPRLRVLIGTGIAVELPENWVALVHPRSGLAWKEGVTVLNAPGTVDSGYRGEIKVNLINHGLADVIINKGDRIAQLVLQEFISASFVEVDELSDTERGSNGHGSTGVK